MGEPLVQFAAIGALLFAVDAWRSAPSQTAGAAEVRSEAASTREPIAIDGAARRQIRARAQRRYGREPTPAELETETERWVDEEILYREAIERGFERGDAVIRERLASRMSYVLEQAVIVPEPGEAELRSWYEAHREQWTVPRRVSFTHVFIGGDGASARRRADEIARSLAAGAAPARLGDRFSGGHRYRSRPLADLARSFGAEFADRLADQPVGRWQLRRSRFGLHLVRVDQVEEERAIDFESARLDVRKQWREARLEAELRTALARVRAGWEVVRR